MKTTAPKEQGGLRLKLWRWLAVSLAMMLGATCAAGAGASFVRSPEQTTVLLLPPLDATPDARNMLAPRQAVIRHRLQVEFIGRQYKVAGETLALRAAAEPPLLDVASLATRTPELMAALARRAGADWVVSLVVQSAEASPSEDGFAATTLVRVQVWDVHRRGWVLDREHAARVAGAGVPPMLFMQSLDLATKGSLTPLLESVPSVVRLQNEESLADYLAAQTNPVIGQRGVLFVPLAVNE